MRISDWSSDVCSSDLHDDTAAHGSGTDDGNRANIGRLDLATEALDACRRALSEKDMHLRRTRGRVAADRECFAFKRKALLGRHRQRRFHPFDDLEWSNQALPLPGEMGRAHV